MFARAEISLGARATRLPAMRSTSVLSKEASIAALARSTPIPPTGTPPTVTSLAMTIGVVVDSVVVVVVVIVLFEGASAV
jgi:hypothetical protein